MRGEFIGVWPETWDRIWFALASEEFAPNDLFCELYRELSNALKVKLKPEELAEIIGNPAQSRDAFQHSEADNFSGEKSLTEFLEKAYDVLNDLTGNSLANPYFNLLSAFVEKYSLRYDLRRPCILCPTLPGVFSNLFRDLRIATNGDVHLNGLMNAFQDAIRDLRINSSEDRIKTCIQKEVNLLEALGCKYPGVTRKTLGAICEQVRTWPHDTVKEAMRNIYTFTNDYPGIRHAGTPANSKRNIEMRDFVAMSILLAGFAPYLTDKIDAGFIYHGK